MDYENVIIYLLLRFNMFKIIKTEQDKIFDWQWSNMKLEAFLFAFPSSFIQDDDFNYKLCASAKHINGKSWFWFRISIGKSSELALTTTMTYVMVQPRWCASFYVISMHTWNTLWMLFIYMQSYITHYVCHNLHLQLGKSSVKHFPFFTFNNN